ncbi:hypothetical protein B0H21DRAFT_810702 [Amylocystis lapponica]|nr:hypothetical protein B0H21DRAFT_810702 [Amylocystis lapponica]
MDMAIELLQDVDAAPPPGQGPPPIDVGFALSFWKYPAASAYTAAGFCHTQIAMSTADPKKVEAWWAEAGRCYLKSVDRRRNSRNWIDFLKIVIETYWHRRRPLHEILPLCKRLREGFPGARKIWEHSTAWDMIMNMVTPTFEFEEKANAGIAEGKYTLDTPSPLVGTV